MAKLDLGGSALLDRADYKGLLAAGFVTTLNSEIDLAAGEWRIYRGSPPQREGYVHVPNAYGDAATSHLLSINAQMGSQNLKLKIDTGSPSALMLDSNAAKRSDLFKSDQPFVPSQTTGFGGDYVRTRIYRVPRLSMHGFDMERVPVTMMQPGTFGQWLGFDGLLGLDAIRQFHISVDADRKRLYLARNGLPFASREEYPMSGLWLDRKGDRITVSELGIGSPAAGAGILTGDLIIGEEWSALLRKISAAKGSTVALDYERGGKRARAEFMLQPYL